MSEKSNLRFELVANIWPIIDASTGYIQRIAARAYVVPSEDDQLISCILTALAPTDYVLAKQFAVSQRFKLVSEYGTLSGIVSVHDFNLNDYSIIKPILDELAEDRPDVTGIALVDGNPKGVRPNLRFASEPYTVTTFLIEDIDGNLFPKLNQV